MLLFALENIDFFFSLLSSMHEWRFLFLDLVWIALAKIEFEHGLPTLKIEYLYRLLVHDKLVQPLAKGQENEPNMKHKLALWISRQLPEDHPLLQ